MTKSPIEVVTQAVQVIKSMILTRIYKLWTEIQEIDDSIKPYSDPKRTRRGLGNAAGSVVKFLLGNPDNRDLDIKLDINKCSAREICHCAKS